MLMFKKLNIKFKNVIGTEIKLGAKYFFINPID